MKRGKKLIAVLLSVLFALTMPGCGKEDADTKLVLTTGFKKDEVFRIESMSCTLPEVMVYLTNTQDQYESVYGKEIWKTGLNDITLEESVKETVLAELAQIKTMNLLARQHGVELDEAEQKMVREAAGAYFETLNQAERETMQVTEETIFQLYAEFALANKVYEFIIKDINPEISDDEARTITVQDILIKTFSMDGAGKRLEYDEEEKQEAKRKAQEILELARQEDSDFEDLLTMTLAGRNRRSFNL